MRPTAPDLSSTSRKMGAAHLALAAAVNGASGSGLLVVAGGDEVRYAVLWSLDRFVAPGVLLDWGPDAVRALILALRIGGVALLAVAALQLAAARFVFVGRRRTLGLVAGLAGMLTLVSLPWALVSIVLVHLTTEQFDTTDTADGEHRGPGA